MREDELIDSWGKQKRSHNYRRLVAACEAEFEFRGQFGHPSSYAYVKFLAEPADELSLEFGVDWPREFDEVYARRIRHSIAEAIVDVLLSKPAGMACRGCKLRLTAFRWDTIGGSERAVYRASAKAMEQLCEQAHWAAVTGRYRVYPD